MKNRNLEHSDNWRTPPEWYKKWDKEFNFDFDPCPYNTGTITPETDGLIIDWGKMNFVNPPYSRKLKEGFVDRGVTLSWYGFNSVFLLPVSTSTKLFHNVIKPNANEIRFIQGRIPFIGINDKGQMVNYHLIQDVTKEVFRYKEKDIPLYIKNSGQHDSMLVVFGKP